MIDSCVLADQRWLAPIVLSARAGYVVPLWSPIIIAETSRLHARLWMKRQGVPNTNAERRAFSDAAHRWFDSVTRVFRVVEDCPPPALQWTADPRDPYDVPIWTAAVRGQAQFVVTRNLRDGPPPDQHGITVYEGIIYIAPGPFLGLLNFWADAMATRQFPALDLIALALDWQKERREQGPLPEPIEEYLRLITQRL